MTQTTVNSTIYYRMDITQSDHTQQSICHLLTNTMCSKNRLSFPLHAFFFLQRAENRAIFMRGPVRPFRRRKFAASIQWQYVWAVLHFGDAHFGHAGKKRIENTTKFQPRSATIRHARYFGNNIWPRYSAIHDRYSATIDIRPRTNEVTRVFES